MPNIEFNVCLVDYFKTLYTYFFILVQKQIVLMIWFENKKNITDYIDFSSTLLQNIHHLIMEN